MINGIDSKEALEKARGRKERLEVLIPAGIRRTLVSLAAEEGISISILVLRALSLGDGRLAIAPIHFEDMRRRITPAS